MQNLLIALGTVIIAGGALLYGALTAPRNEAVPHTSTTPSVVATHRPQTTEQDRDAIFKSLEVAYPKIATDYTIAKGTFYENNTWYGTTMTYKGEDSMNRDTLRVLVQKKDGLWVFRTKPPTPLLSKYDYPDVPVKVLQSINKPVSLPGVDAATSDR